MIIYKITNTLNNKIYIGQTTQSMSARFSSHCRKKVGRSYLTDAIKKYGKENFLIEQIDSAETIEELNKKEEYWISYYNSTNKNIGYNLMSGGKNSTHSLETKAIISYKNSNPSDESRKRRSIAQKNKIVNPKAIEAMRNSTKGKPQTEEHKRKRSEALKGRPRSEETKRKISESRKRK